MGGFKNKYYDLIKHLFYCCKREIISNYFIFQNSNLLCLLSISTNSVQLTSLRKYSEKYMVRTAKSKLYYIFCIELWANSLNVNSFSSLFLWTKKYIPSFCSSEKYLLQFGGGEGLLLLAFLAGGKDLVSAFAQYENSDSATLTWSIDSQCRPTQLPGSGVSYCSRLYHTAPNHPSATNTHSPTTGVYTNITHFEQHFYLFSKISVFLQCVSQQSDR